jgi:hypothetical protein
MSKPDPSSVTVSPEHRLELRCALAEQRAAQLHLQVMEMQTQQAREALQQASLARDAVSSTIRDAYDLSPDDQVNLESGTVTRAAPPAAPAPIIGHAETTPRGQA